MSEAPDPLEAELSALRPLDPSPELRRRVADRLAAAPPANPPRPWRIALASGLAAACLAAALLWWAGRRVVEPRPIAGPPAPAPPEEVEDSGPTLLAYRRALARSPEELEARLNRDALTAPGPRPGPSRICAFTRSDSALRALLGDD
jgi:hypothetical protein